jgi:PAS domain S-box-containing protein
MLASSILPSKTQPDAVSIRTRLVLLVLSCALPAALMAALLIANEYSRQREHVLGEAIRTARAATYAVDGEIAEIQKVLLTMATSPQLAADDFAGFHAQAVAVVSALGLSNISLCDVHGHCILNTRRSFGEALPRHANPPLLQRVVQGGRPVVSDLFVGALISGLVVNVSVPVLQRGTLTYVLGSTVIPDRLADVLHGQQLPPQWLAAVLDSTGTIAARTYAANRFVGKPARPALKTMMAQAPEGVIESVNEEGVPVFIAYSRSQVSHWSVAVGVPRHLLTADLRRSLAWLSLATAVLLAGGLGFASFIGSRIAVALRTLSNKALALPTRPLNPIPPLYFREADELGATLVGASVMLHGANEVLAQAEANLSRQLKAGESMRLTQRDLERKLERGSEELAHSQARLQAIVESAMDAILSFDDGLRIVLFNAAAEAAFGCTRQQALGRSVLEFVPARLREPYEREFRRFGSQARKSRRLGRNGRVTALCADGVEFSAEGSISQMTADGPRVFTIILRDVTRSVQVVAALKQSNLDLQQFAFVASHDLKTPLRSMNGFAEILARDYGPALDGRARDLIGRISASAIRLAALIDALLSYARLNGEPNRLLPVDCTAVVAEMAELLDPLLRETGARLEIDALPTVMGDASQLMQLFLNLAQNAIKYRGDQPPVIRIWATNRDRGWVFSVADNGMGIDAKHHTRIFEIFKRLHTQQAYPGTGIGLSVCRRIVERHGGSIWVEHSSPEGTVFSFTVHPDRPS